MIKGFNAYVKESSGLVTLDKSDIDRRNQPDVVTPLSHVIQGASASKGPQQWGSRGAYGRGANPKIKNKKEKKMSSHIDSYKKFSTKETKKIEEQDGTPDVLDVPEEFVADRDAINVLKDVIARTEQDLAAKKVDLNTKAKALQAKMADRQTKIKNATNPV